VSSWSLSLPNFTAAELGCKHCGVVKIDIRFASALVGLRSAYGTPLSPTSVCRCPDHNASIAGAHPTSLHLTENPKHRTSGTAAADIRWPGSGHSDKLKFARLAYSLGFSVGLHRSFIHIDGRTIAGLPQHVFLYGAWDNHFTPLDVKVGLESKVRLL
jgi:hypothetical protein